MDYRHEIYEKIRITAKGEKERKEVLEGFRILPTNTLQQIAHAEKTSLGITCTFGEPNRDGYYQIPNSCTHVYQHEGNTYFAMPNHCLIIPKGMEMKFNIER